MAMLMALSDATRVTIGLVAIFGIVFPAIVTGCIIFAVAQAAAERQQNLERKHGRNG